MTDGRPYPEDLLYHPDHDWARLSGQEATLGITWYAQEQLGEIVYWDPPAVGSRLTRGQPYTELESVKAVADVIAPLSGEILEVNGSLVESLEQVNDDPHGAGWLVKILVADPGEVEALLAADAYRKLLDR